MCGPNLQLGTPAAAPAPLTGVPCLRFGPRCCKAFELVKAQLLRMDPIPIMKISFDQPEEVFAAHPPALKLKYTGSCRNNSFAHA